MTETARDRAKANLIKSGFHLHQDCIHWLNADGSQMALISDAEEGDPKGVYIEFFERGERALNS